MKTRILTVVAALAVLAGCSSTSVTLEKDRKVTIAKSGTALFYPTLRLANQAREDFFDICALAKPPEEATRQRKSWSAKELLAGLTKAKEGLETSKGIVEIIFPPNTVTFSAECPQDVSESVSDRGGGQ